MDLTGATWRKSSYSGGNGGACVEIKVGPGSKAGSDYVITMRDSKDPSGPVLIFTQMSGVRSSWASRMASSTWPKTRTSPPHDFLPLAPALPPH
jgi:hypothetical protein